MKYIQDITKKIKQYYYVDIRQKKSNFFAINMPLFHYFFIIFILIVLCGINLFNKYKIFLELQKGRVFDATIILHYTKKENSDRFKFQDTDGNIFYGNYKGKFKYIVGRKVSVYGKIYNCNFIRFLKSCNIYNSSFSLLPIENKKKPLLDFIAKQHENKIIANLYNALFFANNLDKQIRQTAINLGISHLLAISGLHLAILMCIFYIFICPFYFFIHRYFCHRNAIYDLGFLGLIFACFYLFLIDFQPSFFRAFIMACIGYIFIYAGIRIINFFNLLLCALVALAFNISLLFNIGFLLSIAGVFYIFLFIRYIDIYINSWDRFIKILAGILIFNCVIFLQMMPIIHYFFPYFSLYQLVSIPLSSCFIVVFPVVVILHIAKYGYVFDSIIESIINYNFPFIEFYTPLWFIIVYLLISLLSIYFRIAYFLLMLCAFIFYAINCLFYFNVF